MRREVSFFAARAFTPTLACIVFRCRFRSTLLSEINTVLLVSTKNVGSTHACETTITLIIIPPRCVSVRRKFQGRVANGRADIASSRRSSAAVVQYRCGWARAGSIEIVAGRCQTRFACFYPTRKIIFTVLRGQKRCWRASSVFLQERNIYRAAEFPKIFDNSPS